MLTQGLRKSLLVTSALTAMFSSLSPVLAAETEQKIWIFEYDRMRYSCINDCSHAITRDKSNLNAWVERALYRCAQGDEDRASADFKSALELMDSQ